MGPGGLAGLPAAALGQEAPTGEVMGRVLPGSLHTQWEDGPSPDARDPTRSGWKLGKQEGGRSGSRQPHLTPSVRSAGSLTKAPSSLFCLLAVSPSVFPSSDHFPHVPQAP